MRSHSLFCGLAKFGWSICFPALFLLVLPAPENLLRAQSVTFTGTQSMQVTDDAAPALIPLRRAQPVATYVDFGSVELGKASQSIALHFSFHSPVLVGKVSVLTQGVEGLDFLAPLTSGNSACSAMRYTAGQDCIVKVVFQPTAPGLRMGAVVFYAPNGKQLLQVPIYGLGSGPLLNYEPAHKRTIASGFAAADAIAVDTGKNIYISDTGTNRIYKISSTGKILQILAGVLHPEGLAIDGSGNLYIADAGNGRVLFVPNEEGALNIADSVKIGTLENPKTIALDGQNNLYVTDVATRSLYKIMLASAPPQEQSKILLQENIEEPVRFAFDTRGNLYAAGENAEPMPNAYELQSFAKSSPGQDTLTSTNRAATADAEGNLFLIDASGIVKEEVRSVPPAFNFNTTTNSAPQTVLLRNIGNLSLSFSGLSVAENFIQQASHGRDCNANTVLIPAGNCIVQLAWQPIVIPFTQSASGTFFSGSVSLIDNNQNQANQRQQIALTAQTNFTKALASHPNTQNSPPKLVFGLNQPPATLLTGNSIGAVNVYVEDSGGNAVSSPSYPVTLTVSGPANYSYSSTQTSRNGMASFNLPNPLTIAGTYAFQASSSQLNVTLTPAATAEVVSGLATTTTLTISPSPSTTVATNTLIQLKATVKDTNQNLVSSGIVEFYDGTTLLGSTQLLSGSSTLGTATFAHRFPFGLHSLKAAFLPTNQDQSSASPAQTLNMTGTVSSVTSLSTSTATPYTLTAEVSAYAPASAALSGTINFLDQSNTNAIIGSANLGAITTNLSYAAITNPITNASHYSYNQQNFITTGDFNNDGIPDLAVTDYGYTQITILLGNGNGTFTSQSTIALTNANPVSIAVGDFNRDGNQDLAVLMRNTGIILVLLGNGNGTFLYPSVPQITTGMSTPLAMTAADFNGDGNLDLAVVNSQANNVTLYLGHGDDTFTQTAVPYDAFPVGNLPVSITTADFNEDGLPDLAVGNQGDGTVTVLLNTGNAHFQPAPAAPITVGSSPQFVLAGDWNHDGHVDLAVANAGSNTISILLGNGQGSFSEASASPIAVGGQPYSIASADLNGDGNPDLVIANKTDNSLTLLSGDGSGGFFTSAASTIAVGNQPVSVAVTDLNIDGTPDLVTANFADAPSSVVLGILQQTATATAANVSIPCGITNGAHIIAAQFTGTDSIAPSNSNTASLSCTPSQVTPLISWPQPGTISYGTDLSRTLNAIATYNGQSVSGTILYTTLVNSISTGINASTLLPAGSYTITATFTPTDTSHYNSATTQVNLQVAKAMPTLTWALPVGEVYGAGLSSAQLDAATTVAGTFAYSPSAGTVLSAGTHTLSVTFTPTDAADYTTQTASVPITVSQALLTITAASSTIGYGQAVPASAYSIGGFVNGDTASVVSGAPSLTTSPASPANAGSYTIAAAPGTLSASNYQFQFVNGTLTIRKAALQAAAANATMPYGATLPALSGSLTGVVAGDGITASYATAATSSSAAGTYPITATLQDPNNKLANYTVTNTAGTLTIGQAPLTVQIGSASAVYGAALPASYPVQTTGLVNHDSLGSTLLLHFAPVAVQGSGVGSYAVNATVTGTAANNYSITVLPGTLALTPLALTATAQGVRFVYGQSRPVLSGTLNGVLPQDAGKVTAVYSSSADSASAVGAYPITVSLAGSAAANYIVQLAAAGSSAAAAVATVTPAPLQVFVNSITRGYGAQNPAFSGTVSGIVNHDAITASYSTTATAASTAGTYPITATLSGAALSNYAPVITAGTLTIADATLTATAASATRVYGMANPPFTGTLSGQQNGDVFTEAFTTTATPTSPVGAYAITPVVNGADANDYSIDTVPGTLTITQAGSSIALASSATSAGTGSTITLTASVRSASSGSPTGSVTFFDGSYPLGSAHLNPNGSASLNTSFPSPASHLLSASYLGDLNFSGSLSNSLDVSVIGSSGFTVRIVPGTLTVQQGQAGLAEITITPSSGYAGTFTLSCSGIPQYSLCALPSTKAIADGSGKQIKMQLELQTSGLGFRYGATSVAMVHQRGGPMLAMIFLLPGGLVMFRSKKKTVRLKHLLMLMILCAGLTSLSACSGMQPLLTPTGTYSVVVHVSASTAEAESASLNLKVVP